MDTHRTDSIAIAHALEEYYFKGIYEGDLNKLDKIYHSGTLLFGDVKGQPYAKTLAEYLDGVQHRQSPKDSGKPFKGEILNIRVVNSIYVIIKKSSARSTEMGHGIVLGWTNCSHTETY